MRRKLSVLRACRRTLRPGGRLAFLTILPAPGLASNARRRANRLGPVAVAVRTSYPNLLRSAGFSDVRDDDLTEDYRSTLLRWIAATNRREADIRAATGDDLYDERAENRQRTLEAIDAGLLQRRLYTAAS